MTLPYISEVSTAPNTRLSTLFLPVVSHYENISLRDDLVHVSVGISKRVFALNPVDKHLPAGYTEGVAAHGYDPFIIFSL